MEWVWYTTVIVLLVVSLVLPFVGVIRGVISASRTIERHEASHRESMEIRGRWNTERQAMTDWNLGRTSAPPPADQADFYRKLDEIDNRYSQEFTDRGLVVPNVGNADADPLGEFAVLRALKLVASGNRTNALFVVLGAAAGFIASVVSLWPPA